MIKLENLVICRDCECFARHTGIDGCQKEKLCLNSVVDCEKWHAIDKINGGVIQKKEIKNGK